MLFEDFVDLTQNMTQNEMLKKKGDDSNGKKGGRRASKLIGESSFAGFRFMKAVLIRTRFPLHELILEILNGFIGIINPPLFICNMLI